MLEIKIVTSEEGRDSLGTPFASVSVSDGPNGQFIATHSSFSRGGCLAAGTAYLRNWKTGKCYEVDITSWASATELHARYLISLCEKHVGAAA